MKENKNQKLIMYLFSLILMANLNSMFMLWILMEINMVMFILLMEEESCKNKCQKSLFYFMIQSLGSMMILMACFMETSMKMNISKEVLTLAMMLKMGLFPMQNWMYKISSSLNYKEFTILLTLQKIPTMMILITINSISSTMVIITSMMAGSIMMMKSEKIKDLMISSSIYSTIWMTMAIQISLNFFILMYAIYTSAVYTLMKIEEKNKNFSTSKSKVLLTLSMSFLIGLPPTSMMMMKTYILNFFMNSTENLIIFMIWLATFMATISYMKFLIKIFWIEKKLLYNSMNMETKMSFLMMMMLMLNSIIFI